MFVIIVGAGNLGYYLAELLVDENHDVLVIDKDKEKCEKISTELDIVATQADATESKVLDKAGIKECDALIALTESDETNMVVSLLAKELGVKQVITRISKVEYDEKVLKKLGIDLVIHPEAAAAGYIAELITKPEVLDLAFISRGAAEIMEIEIGHKSKARGKKISEIAPPEGSAIVAILEDANVVIPKQDTMIKKGDKLLVLSKRDIADKVRKMLS